MKNAGDGTGAWLFFFFFFFAVVPNFHHQPSLFLTLSHSFLPHPAVAVDIISLPLPLSLLVVGG